MIYPLLVIVCLCLVACRSFQIHFYIYGAYAVRKQSTTTSWMGSTSRGTGPSFVQMCTCDTHNTAYAIVPLMMLCAFTLLYVCLDTSPCIYSSHSSFVTRETDRFVQSPFAQEHLGPSSGGAAPLRVVSLCFIPGFDCGGARGSERQRSSKTWGCRCSKVHTTSGSLNNR